MVIVSNIFCTPFCHQINVPSMLGIWKRWFRQISSVGTIFPPRFKTPLFLAILVFQLACQTCVVSHMKWSTTDYKVNIVSSSGIFKSISQRVTNASQGSLVIHLKHRFNPIQSNAVSYWHSTFARRFMVNACHPVHLNLVKTCWAQCFKLTPNCLVLYTWINSSCIMYQSLFQLKSCWIVIATKH
jgi:hypothetical protein